MSSQKLLHPSFSRFFLEFLVKISSLLRYWTRYERDTILYTLYTSISPSDYTVQTRAKAQSAEFGQLPYPCFILFKKLIMDISLIYSTLLYKFTTKFTSVLLAELHTSIWNCFGWSLDNVLSKLRTLSFSSSLDCIIT